MLVVHGGISDSTDLDLIRSLDRSKYVSLLRPPILENAESGTEVIDKVEWKQVSGRPFFSRDTQSVCDSKGGVSLQTHSKWIRRFSMSEIFVGWETHSSFNSLSLRLSRELNSIYFTRSDRFPAIDGRLNGVVLVLPVNGLKGELNSLLAANGDFYGITWGTGSEGK